MRWKQFDLCGEDTGGGWCNVGNHSGTHIKYRVGEGARLTAGWGKVVNGLVR